MSIVGSRTRKREKKKLERCIRFERSPPARRLHRWDVGASAAEKESVKGERKMGSAVELNVLASVHSFAPFVRS